MFSKLDIDDDLDRENDESNLSTRPVVFEIVVNWWWRKFQIRYEIVPWRAHLLVDYFYN